MAQRTVRGEATTVRMRRSFDKLYQEHLGYDDGNPTSMTTCGGVSPRVARRDEQNFSIKGWQS